jgi:hypothetical protein
MRDVHLRFGIDRSTCQRSHLSLVFCECLQVIIHKGDTDLAYKISPMYRESLRCVTDCVKMYENRQFENAGSNRLDQASLASMIGDADDAQSREVYGSIWPRMRKLLPSMTTVSAWCSSRSRMAAVRVLSLLNILGHSLNARFEVSMIEPCS